MAEYISPFLRLFVAVLLGGIIGFERAERGREAGLRTHIMVCLGACLVMLISEYVVNTLNMNTDVTRLGAQVISGIGFLGVGCIINDGDKIKGLTTAAGLWVTACVGLATGIGNYIVATATTVIMILVMLLITPLSKKILASKSKVAISVKASSGEAFGSVYAFLENKVINITSIEKNPTTGAVKFVAVLSPMKDVDLNILLQDLYNIDGVIEVMRENR